MSCLHGVCIGMKRQAQAWPRHMPLNTNPTLAHATLRSASHSSCVHRWALQVSPWFLMASWEVWTFGRGCCSIRARAAAPALWDPSLGALRLCLDPQLLCTTSALELNRYEDRKAEWSKAQCLNSQRDSTIIGFEHISKGKEIEKRKW